MLVAAAVQPASSRAGDLFDGASPALKEELAEARGGFALPSGAVVDIRFTSTLSVDGRSIDLPTLEAGGLQRWSDAHGVDIEVVRGLAGAVIALRNSRDGAQIQLINDIRIDVSGADVARQMISRSALQSFASTVGSF
ncbi:hypothetical protein [uncultured Phenylobacterium sp.]|uniref:hypothetical protein n=1 Tax=uncultured Phenylobacterium sp. TaxID=349273 RepID=UPI0025CD201E|nr:hypothetical protein [uncultured Phenylobacterium sp.]